MHWVEAGILPCYCTGDLFWNESNCKKHLGKDSLSGLNVGVQGRACGVPSLQVLKQEGANLYVTDMDESALKRVVDEFGVQVIGMDDIYDADLDIYAPCALGATLNDETIPNLKCSIVAGAANNQLKNEDVHAQMLKDRGFFMLLITPSTLAG